MHFALIVLFSFMMLETVDAGVDDLTKAKVVSQSKIRKDLDDTKALESALFRDPDFTSYVKNLHVQVEDGVATLTGFVPAVEIKTAIERKALAVPGITSVLNYIEIKSHNTSSTPTYTPDT
jgi:osmotically-inducible protein OsmY